MEIKALRDNVMLIGHSTIEDVESALDRFGYSQDDFDFKVQDDTQYSSGLYHTYSTVHVTYKPNGIKRSYAAGHQSAFAAEFERDLQGGFYR